MKIAVIGSGISGLAAAYLLNQQHEVCLYEKNTSLGGHSRTIDVHLQGKSIAVDTGFIVFNRRNYPHLTALFKLLNVPVAESRMSFGVSIDDGWLEYGTQNFCRLFASKRNMLQPKFWLMLRDIKAFNDHAKQYLHTDLTLGACLHRLNLGEWFQHYYLLPMAGAIWSTSIKDILHFPAATLIQFFDNHGLLTVRDQPQWYTVKGGSAVYVSKLAERLKGCIKLDCQVTGVIRQGNHVLVEDRHGQTNRYDQVVLACHADQALHVLKHPTRQEQQILANIRYQPNDIVVHADTAFLPKRQQAWSSWNYLGTKKQAGKAMISLSYWMNNLQPLETSTPVIVTLNPEREPEKHLIFDRFAFEHPVFNQASLNAQKQMDAIQGKDNIWFAGAWQSYGFHEDGLHSAVKVAEKIGVRIPWQ